MKVKIVFVALKLNIKIPILSVSFKKRTENQKEETQKEIKWNIPNE